MKKIIFTLSLTIALSAVALAQEDGEGCKDHPSLSDTQSARQIAQIAFPSVALLVMEDANSQPVSLGSGFFVKADIVATNLHVIEGAARGYIKIVGQKPKYEIAGVVGIDAQRDLALLKITGVKAPCLTFGDVNQVAVGDEVYAVGNPQGLEGTFSQGIVSGIRQIGSDTIFQITAPISPGSSGGPVLNSQGKVIGIAVATFSGGQNLNFAIPASYLSGLMSEIKPIVPLSAKATPKQKKSLLDDLGGRSVEGVIGENFTWSSQLYVDGSYSFTLRNQLRESVKDVHCLVVFYDRNGKALDFDVVYYRDVIPAGLGKRVNGRVHESVKRLTTPPSRDDPYQSSFTPATKVEFRILDFKIMG
jgi:hypothetical protein